MAKKRTAEDWQDLQLRRELGVIKCVLLDSTVVEQVNLAERHFQPGAGRMLWQTVLRLRAGGDDRQITSQVLLEEATTDVKLRRTLEEWLRHARTSIAHPRDLEVIVAELRAKSDLDAISDLAEWAHAEVAEHGWKPDDLVDELQAKLEGLRSAQKRSDIDGRQASWRFVQETHKAVLDAEAGKSAQRVPTGITQLDEAIGGFPRGMITLVGARPSVGKTAFLMNAAFRCGVPTLALVLEELRRDIAAREVAFATGVSVIDMVTLRVSRADWAKIMPVQGDPYEQFERIRFVDAHGMTAPDVARAVKLHVAKSETAGARISLVIVDYLNRLQMRDGENGYVQIRRAMDCLNEMAAALDIACVVGCQLSRKAEQDGREPQLSDLRDSGSLEEIAKVVLLLHRPGKGTDRDDQLEIHIAKTSHGRTGTICVDWHGPTMTMGADGVVQVQNRPRKGNGKSDGQQYDGQSASSGEPWERF